MAQLFPSRAWGVVTLFIIKKCCACDSLPPSTHPSKATAVVEGQCPHTTPSSGAVLCTAEVFPLTGTSHGSSHFCCDPSDPPVCFVCRYLAVNVHTTA